MKPTQNIYGVSQVTQYIKNMFQQDFLLQQIWIRGEVSNCKYHSSGHLFFTLKDDEATMGAVMFRTRVSRMEFRMKEGDKVLVRGNLDVYAPQGTYRLLADEIVLDGEGALYRKYEELKASLEEMGMFSPEYKQPIPKYVRRVGIVTSSTGAVIQDICNVAGRRNPYVELILCPAAVQGEGAVPSIVSGIARLDREGVDVIIVGRGGGSIEDLWAFNSEEVARAIFQCETPIISAVGHETDTTIADFVADLRAPTPSAAAELAVYEYMTLVEELQASQGQLARSLTRRMHSERQKIHTYEVRLQALSPGQRLKDHQQKLADLSVRLQRQMELSIQRRKAQLALLAERLEGHSPLRRMSQGYAFISDADGVGIRSVEQFAEGDTLQIYVSDGRAKVTVDEINRTTERNADSGKDR